MSLNWFHRRRCINLITRPDRHKESKEVFDKHGINVEYYMTTRHPNGGIEGCFNSHINILRDSYDRGDEHVVIFEDDLIDSPYLTSDNIKKVIDFVKSNNDWDLFYLGTHPVIWDSHADRITDSIYRLKSICTHAYIASRRLMKKLYHAKFTGTPIDYLYRDNYTSYGIYPSMFYQRGSSTSDITDNTKIFNRIISSFPYKDKWFRAVEMYAFYINQPVRYVLLLIFIVLLIVIVYLAAVKGKF